MGLVIVTVACPLCSMPAMPAVREMRCSRTEPTQCRASLFRATAALVSRVSLSVAAIASHRDPQRHTSRAAAYTIPCTACRDCIEQYTTLHGMASHNKRNQHYACDKTLKQAYSTTRVPDAFKDSMIHKLCNSHYVSHFAAFFIVARAKRSIVKSCVAWCAVCRDKWPGAASVRRGAQQDTHCAKWGVHVPHASPSTLLVVCASLVLVACPALPSHRLC